MKLRRCSIFTLNSIISMLSFMVYLIHQIYAYTIRCETCLGTFIKHVDNSKKRLEGK
jgi:hypothetical protein